MAVERKKRSPYNKRAGERRVAPQPRHTRAQPQSTRALAGLTWRAASRASASTHMRAATKHGGLSRAQCVHTPRGGSRGTADTPPRRYASLGSLAPNPPQRENKAPRTRVRKTRHDDALSKWVEDLHTQEDRRRTARYRRRPEAASRARASEAGCAGRVTQSRKSPMRRNGRRAGTPIELCRQALAERCRRAHWLQTPPAIDGREFAAPSTG